MAAATAVLLGLSVGVDTGLPEPVAAVAAVVVLFLVRARGGMGASVLVAVAYPLVRVIVAVLSWSFGTAVAPLAWQGLLAAVAVEAVAGLYAAAAGRQLGRGASGSPVRP